VTEATYTSTVTDAPDGVVTLYSGADGQVSTYGAETIYEVYIYTTTQSVDIVGSGVRCGISWGKRNAEPCPAPLTAPPAAALPTLGY